MTCCTLYLPRLRLLAVSSSSRDWRCHQPVSVLNAGAFQGLTQGYLHFYGWWLSRAIYDSRTELIFIDFPLTIRYKS